MATPGAGHDAAVRRRKRGLGHRHGELGLYRISTDTGCVRRFPTCGARFECRIVDGSGYESQPVCRRGDPTAGPPENPEFNAVLDDGRERYEGSFVRISERAKQKEIDLETDIVVGHPAEQIIHKAEAIQASLIVMGQRSHTVFHRWVLGSNSERVLKYAHCPVMIVH
jgi:nucleotide-binding universal stress UspA family protein